MQPTKKIMRAALAALVFVLVLLLGASVALAAPTFNRPINSDSGHVANAIALSKGTFSSGVPAAVVTTADSYADSLSASVLASVYGGPLLLTSGSSLSADVASELSGSSRPRSSSSGSPRRLRQASRARSPVSPIPPRSSASKVATVMRRPL